MAFPPITAIKVYLDDYELIQVDSGDNLHSYLVNNWVMYKSIVTYLSKYRDCSSFQVKLSPKMTLLHPLRWWRFINDSRLLQEYTRYQVTWLPIESLGYVQLSCDSLVKNRDFSLSQEKLPPKIAFSHPLRWWKFILMNIDWFGMTLRMN